MDGQTNGHMMTVNTHASIRSVMQVIMFLQDMWLNSSSLLAIHTQGIGNVWLYLYNSRWLFSTQNKLADFSRNIHEQQTPANGTKYHIKVFTTVRKSQYEPTTYCLKKQSYGYITLNQIKCLQWLAKTHSKCKYRTSTKAIFSWPVCFHNISSIPWLFPDLAPTFWPFQAPFQALQTVVTQYNKQFNKKYTTGGMQEWAKGENATYEINAYIDTVGAVRVTVTKVNESDSCKKTVHDKMLQYTPKKLSQPPQCIKHSSKLWQRPTLQMLGQRKGKSSVFQKY